MCASGATLRVSDVVASARSQDISWSSPKTPHMRSHHLCFLDGTHLHLVSCDSHSCYHCADYAVVVVRSPASDEPRSSRLHTIIFQSAAFTRATCGRKGFLSVAICTQGARKHSPQSGAGKSQGRRLDAAMARLAGWIYRRSRHNGMLRALSMVVVLLMTRKWPGQRR